jgi:hypothetical protein
MALPDLDAIDVNRKMSTALLGHDADAAYRIAKVDSNGNLFVNASGFEITGYDYILLTYVAAGNGAGEIETAVFRTGGAAGTIIATLTIVYDASNRISTVTKT